MPQMSPLKWLFLYMYFILILMIIKSLNFYLYFKLPLKMFSKKFYIKKWMW
uniref:ATP synthase F0 subunit 8 n=1 Tax=Xiphydria sp. ZJUH 2008002 TaxID=2488325 RepID=A0A3G5BC70_9HYME|nr:ATP synthase F0 subunit 8 [Euxiphydria potanini]AYV97246.1 ATP synthase F0 subunit 8 [Xiphydria sp. ZJUH 2008002]UYW35398.1 ATP synthase subunit 8 [Euxiphydria potanini]